jgi:hypothetical protein
MGLGKLKSYKKKLSAVSLQLSAEEKKIPNNKVQKTKILTI